jgi:hypothetical protein
MSEPLPALWGLLGHGEGFNATLAHATESCVTNAQVCLPRVGAPAQVLSRRRARVANERKVLQCMSCALCGTHARARPPQSRTAFASAFPCTHSLVRDAGGRARRTRFWTRPLCPVAVGR